ncbi:MAG: DUF3108 domain-containing protein [Ignavibacteria bacterium]
MKILKKLLFVLLFLYFCGFSNAPLHIRNEMVAWSHQLPKEMIIGEDITYVVKYSLIKLGEVRLQVLEKKEKNGRVYYRTRALIDSYSDIPFVDLHQIYESNFNTELYSDYFKHTEKEKSYVKFTEYFFDYTKSTVRVKKGKYNPFQIWADSTTRVKTRYQDGLSLFYFARMNTGTRKTVDVPCFVTDKFVNTKINFHGTIENISIDAVNYEIPCASLDGHTDFVSIFGLTGNFEGWFTNDKNAVPAIARMKVIIGNVTLELKSWKKNNWNPPGI